ncbi:MAG TPA: hypothetical protein VM511_04120 [Luteolibacter sp.]|nr:hypothetical protein [Luteolibacter sp.]
MKRLLSISSLLFGIAVAEPVAIPLPDSPLPDDRTVVWSPLFPATWDALKEQTGPLVSVDPPNPTITGLEAFRFDRKTVFPETSWKTWSGPSTQEFLATVNSEAAEMLGEPKGPFQLSIIDPANRVAFGLLNHRIEFRRPLHRSKKIPMKFKSGQAETDVAFFGTKGKHPSVEVLAWNAAERFHALKLHDNHSDAGIILYLPPAPMDLRTAWTKVMEIQKKPEMFIALGDKDEVRIPYLDLKSESDLTSYFTGTIRFGKLEPTSQFQARQLTLFKLHEKGAEVRVETAMDPFAGGPPEPRHFIYDRPFFVFMAKKDAEWPYFGAWIATTDGMEPFSAAAK